MIAVVRLDDASYGAGPGTVLALCSSVQDARVRNADRDGCVPSDLRFWKASVETRIGDRVCAMELV